MQESTLDTSQTLIMSLVFLMRRMVTMSEPKTSFKRAKIRPDIFNNLFYYTRFQIRPGDRPDDVSQEVYDTPNYDWVVMLGNNIINPGNEWPLTQDPFDDYLMKKYGSEENINATNHYETIEVTDSLGKVLIPAGLTVPKNFRLDYYDYGLGSETDHRNHC